MPRQCSITAITRPEVTGAALPGADHAIKLFKLIEFHCAEARINSSPIISSGVLFSLRTPSPVFATTLSCWQCLMRAVGCRKVAHAQKPVASEAVIARYLRQRLGTDSRSAISGIAVGHTECCCAVIKTPAEVDRGRDIRCQLSQESFPRQNHELRRRCRPPMYSIIARLGRPGRGKQILPRLQIDDALMDVERGARLALHGLGHEGGVHVVLCRLRTVLLKTKTRSASPAGRRD